MWPKIQHISSRDPAFQTRSSILTTARLGDKKQTRRQNMAEIRCIMFIENNDNLYEIYNNYIKLSIVFHPMIIFLGNKKIEFLPGILVILCIIDLSPFKWNFDLDKSGQKFHHGLKEHHKISNIPNFRCKIL
jgi:hypothetical protein